MNYDESEEEYYLFISGLSENSVDLNQYLIKLSDFLNGICMTGFLPVSFTKFTEIFFEFVLPTLINKIMDFSHVSDELLNTIENIITHIIRIGIYGFYNNEKNAITSLSILFRQTWPIFVRNVKILLFMQDKFIENHGFDAIEYYFMNFVYSLNNFKMVMGILDFFGYQILLSNLFEKFNPIFSLKKIAENNPTTFYHFEKFETCVAPCLRADKSCIKQVFETLTILIGHKSITIDVIFQLHKYFLNYENDFIDFFSIDHNFAKLTNIEINESAFQIYSDLIQALTLAINSNDSFHSIHTLLNLKPIGILVKILEQIIVLFSDQQLYTVADILLINEKVSDEYTMIKSTIERELHQRMNCSYKSQNTSMNHIYAI